MQESRVSTTRDSKSEEENHQIAREEILARLQDPGFVLLDVMPKETFEDGHIPRSLNLPLSDIESRSRQLFPEVGRELAIYCGGPT